MKIEIKKHYKYGVVRGTDGHRTGWYIIRQRVTPLLHIPFWGTERGDHLFYNKDAAIDALNWIDK